jgi:CRP-like cAMP-binding protein
MSVCRNTYQVYHHHDHECNTIIERKIMISYSKSDIIERSNLFSNISSENRAAVADICIAKNIGKKEILFNEGDKGFALFLLVSGSIQLYKSSADRDVVIKVVKPLEMFAEVVLFEEDRYPVSAIALKPSLVYMIPKHQFCCLLEDPVFRRDFISNLMRKLRYLAEQIQYLSINDVEDRLRLFLEQQYGRAKEITAGFSKKEVAKAIGTTPETLSRILLRLRQHKSIVWNGKKIEISASFWQV